MNATAQMLTVRRRPSTPSLGLHALRWSFLGSLTVGPICFGATEPWSLFILQVSGVVILLLWTPFPAAELRIRPDALALMLPAFGFVVISQLLFHRTVYAYSTQQELLKITLYFLFFVLAQQLLRTHQARRQCSQFLGAFGGVFALFAIVQKFHGNGRIYWLRMTEMQSFVGSYANKNHYAGLMEMLIPFALLIAVSEKEEASTRTLFAFASSVMVGSVFLSGSRGGILVIFFELAVFLIAIVLLSPARRIRSTPYIVVIMLAIALVTWIGGNALMNMMSFLRDPAADASLSNRAQILQDSMQLIKARPLLGWGLGTFSTVYPQVQSWYSNAFVNAAHDDYLQLLVETGVVGLGTILCFIILLYRVGMKRILQIPRSVTFAGLVGCTGILLHSFTDFNMHVPANAALFFALCGLICATSDDLPPNLES